jgi:hypothetical protein
MSGTRRTPIARRSTEPQITPTAIELFKQIERAGRARKKTVGCTIAETSGYCTAECRACRQWYDLHTELHAELRFKPWVWPCLPRNPYPPNSAAAAAWRPGSDQQALWDQLDAARRAQPTKEHPHVEA